MSSLLGNIGAALEAFRPIQQNTEPPMFYDNFIRRNGLEKRLPELADLPAGRPRTTRGRSLEYVVRLGVQTSLAIADWYEEMGRYREFLLGLVVSRQNQQMSFTTFRTWALQEFARRKFRYIEYFSASGRMSGQFGYLPGADFATAGWTDPTKLRDMVAQFEHATALMSETVDPASKLSIQKLIDFSEVPDGEDKVDMLFTDELSLCAGGWHASSDRIKTTAFHFLNPIYHALYGEAPWPSMW